MKRLAGIDLAWATEKNPSAVALGTLNEDGLLVTEVHSKVIGQNAIIEALGDLDTLDGVAIDASLIINNKAGQRPCEKALTKEYASRKAGCHPTNLKLYPDAESVRLSKKLEAHGFEHLGQHRFQIECYPHPALIEIFGLPERAAYKHGTVESRRIGQKRLARLINSLKRHKALALQIAPGLRDITDDGLIDELRGSALKSNEDALDSLICLYIAAKFCSTRKEGVTYGDTLEGYVWVPTR